MHTNKVCIFRSLAFWRRKQLCTKGYEHSWMCVSSPLSMTPDKEIIMVVTREVCDKGAPEDLVWKTRNQVCPTLPTNCKMSGSQSPKTKTETAEMMKVSYTSAFGSLMYTMVCTRSNISYTVRVVIRFMSNPGFFPIFFCFFFIF